MRAAPLGPSVELNMGPRSAVLGVGDACRLCHWGPQWSSLRATQRCAGRGRRMRAAPRGPSVEPLIGSRSAAPRGGANGIFGGVPSGATKRCS
eukprot:1978072-Pyramimonas_sp.AAC.1